jgi:hypothetical protein
MLRCIVEQSHFFTVLGTWVMAKARSLIIAGFIKF